MERVEFADVWILFFQSRVRRLSDDSQQDFARKCGRRAFWDEAVSEIVTSWTISNPIHASVDDVIQIARFM